MTRMLSESLAIGDVVKIKENRERFLCNLECEGHEHYIDHALECQDERTPPGMHLIVLRIVDNAFLKLNDEHGLEITVSTQWGLRKLFLDRILIDNTLSLVE